MDLMAIRRRMLMASKKRLPKEYQEVEWIANSGTQYLVTRSFDSITRVDGDVEFTVAQRGDQMIFGAYQTNATWYAQYYDGRSWYGSISYSRYRNVGNCGLPYYNNVVGVRFKFILTDESLRVITSTSDVSTPPNETVGTPINPIYIFARNKNNAPEYKNNGLKVYSFKMFDGNNLAQELVPCYRKSDGEIGMYDTVSKTFYTNAGTGTFLKGADV